MKDIVIVGAGGFGCEALWTMERINEREPTWNVIGFADDDPALAGKSVEGVRILGSIEQVDKDYPGVAVFIALGDNAIREKLYRQLRGHDFPIIVDPSAQVAPTADIRHGSFVGPNAVISVATKLGKFVVVNTRAGIGHDCELEDFSQVCPGGTISGHCKLEAGAYVASNACTAPGITVGKNAKIAAGIPAYTDVAAGTVLSAFGSLKTK